MKGQRWWIVSVLSLCSACATHRPSEMQVLAAQANRASDSNITCAYGEVRLCNADFDGQLSCTCTDQQSVFGPRWDSSAWFDR